MILILGGNGYVGAAMQKSCQRAALPFAVVSRREVDYATPAVLRAFLMDRRPDFIINAAGFTGRPNVDACELHKADCLAGNAVLPGTIRGVCEDLEIPWGHVSSGCIFTGSRPDGSGFSEDDPPNFSFRQDNCSFYSGTKALGEEVLADAEQCYIWRLRIPFNNQDSPRNYLSKVMRYDRLLDAVNSLSQLDEFCDACVQSWHDRIPFGVYNLTNPGSVSTRQVVDLITAGGLSDKSFEFFDSEEQFMELAAKTPRSNCVLDSSKALSAGLRLSPVEQALQRAIQNWQPEAA
jgi:dTDP-4-dehydrorhamnose reductase